MRRPVQRRDRPQQPPTQPPLCAARGQLECTYATHGICSTDDCRAITDAVHRIITGAAHGGHHRTVAWWRGDDVQ